MVRGNANLWNPSILVFVSLECPVVELDDGELLDPLWGQVPPPLRANQRSHGECSLRSRAGRGDAVVHTHSLAHKGKLVLVSLPPLETVLGIFRVDLKRKDLNILLSIYFKLP